MVWHGIIKVFWAGSGVTTHVSTFTIDNPVVMSNLQEVLTENGYMTNSIHTVKEHHQIYKGPLLSPGDDGDDGDVHPQDRKPRYDN